MNVPRVVRPVLVSETTATCPDCASGHHHDKTCPLGLTIDRTYDSDASWFKEHPQANYYYRPSSWDEREYAKLIRNAIVPTRTRVEYYRDGFHGRFYGNIYMQDIYDV